jgi:glycosyltransferase involved in cell wall biosynthesis
MHRIVIVTPTAYLIGGVQTWLDYLIPSLEKNGWIVTVILPHGKYSDAYKYLQEHPFSNFRVLHNPTGSTEGRIYAIYSALESLQPKLVLNVNIVDTYTAIERLRTKYKESSPLIVMTLHGFQADFYEDIQNYSHIIDGIITTNKLNISAINDMNLLAQSSIYYAPCGVNLPSKLWRNQSRDILKLLFVGRLNNKEKNIFDIPLIFQELDKLKVKYKLSIVGNGSDEEQLKYQIKSLNLDGEVDFLGVLDPLTIEEKIYPTQDVLLITSPAETGPIVAWEAMSNGLVLVTSQYVGSGIEGSLHDGKNCLMFPIGDVKAAAQAISRLQDPELRFNLSQAGRELVCQRYSRAHSIQMWEEAINQILKLPPKQLSKSLQKLPASGKLDRLLGNRLAETVRNFLGIRFEHQSAGGEWPHSYGTNANEEEFIKRLQNLENTSN